MKGLPWLLFGAAVLAALYVFTLLLNAGSMLDDSRSEASRLRDRSNLALEILRKDWVGRDVTAVASLSEELAQKGVIVGSEEGAVEVGDLVFVVKSGVITEVRYID
ncbi:MAG: hypothetical protein AB1671_29155 [Thermodesulfobacteriota bacterium]